MSLTEEQIKQISASILISDVLTYIEEHQQEYEDFIKSEEIDRKEKCYDNIRKTKSTKTMGKLDLSKNK